MRLDAKAIGDNTSRSGTKTDPTQLLDSDADHDLFIALKSLRMSIAKDNNVPPYVVFHDKTLIEMILKKPSNLNEMSHIPGVGQSKLEKYGQAFLNCLS
jgi:ATP-dependent DNA helicase RecQ